MFNLVSIIVPVYKAEKTLDKCINSLINQTHKNIEVILIEDGSPDNSGEICDKYAQKDSRIVVIHKKNEGVAQTRNIGISLAKGEYITFVDADDYIEENYIKALYAEMENKEIDLVLSGYNKVRIEEGKTNIVQYRSKEINQYTDVFLKDIFLYINKMLVQGPCFKLFKKSIINKNDIQFPREMSFGEDTVFVYKYIKNCVKIKNIDACLYNYRCLSENNTLSTIIREDKMDIFLNLFDMLKELLICFDAYTEYNEQQMKANIRNRLTYLSSDVKNMNKKNAYKIINKTISNKKIIESFQEKNSLNLQENILRYFMLKKDIKSIYRLFMIKEKIRKYIK